MTTHNTQETTTMDTTTPALLETQVASSDEQPVLDYWDEDFYDGEPDTRYHDAPSGW